MSTTDEPHVEFSEWVDHAARGDSEGLAFLWRRYQPLVLRYFRGRLPDAAEDLASAVWIDVASNLSAFSGSEDGFRGWIFTIAHRRLVDEHRRRERRPERVVSDTDEVTSTLDIAGDVSSLDAALMLIRRLPADQAEAVLLRVVADLDVATVAEIMQRREGSVRVLVHRGLAKLAVLCQKPVTNEESPAMNEVS
ncbi:MAG: polymerase sigma-70 factor, subfamily [Ilumatobacteraceae bacterium]|nr:polymerase sigma-70 factor, subfamily [Ilumatobacteraceae bacterium]